MEIPEPLEPANEDYVDVKLIFVDNGDDKVFLGVALGGNLARPTYCSCRFYIPCFNESRIMIAGSGDSVFLKNVAVKQIARVQEFLPTQHNSYKCCRII